MDNTNGQWTMKNNDNNHLTQEEVKRYEKEVECTKHQGSLYNNCSLSPTTVSNWTKKEEFAALIMGSVSKAILPDYCMCIMLTITWAKENGQ